MREKNTVCSLLIARSDIPDEVIAQMILSLPFGESEKARLRARKNLPAVKNSLCSLLCLEKLMKARGLDRSFADMTIVRDEQGKPRFESLPLFFSISHSRDVCVVALCKENIGVDLEFSDSSRDIFGLSERFFSRCEHAALLDSKDPRASFFALWTKKEAHAKLLGSGLAAICANSQEDTQGCGFKEYALSLDGESAYLALCFEKKPRSFEIEISNLAKELEIYEIPN